MTRYVQIGQTTDASVSGDKHYFHTQSVAEHTWIIEHKLGKVPTLSYFDNDSPPKKIEPDTETHPDDNQTIATFRVGGILAPQGGKATAN